MHRRRSAHCKDKKNNNKNNSEKQTNGRRSRNVTHTNIEQKKNEIKTQLASDKASNMHSASVCPCENRVCCILLQSGPSEMRDGRYDDEGRPKRNALQVAIKGFFTSHVNANVLSCSSQNIYNSQLLGFWTYQLHHIKWNRIYGVKTCARKFLYPSTNSTKIISHRIIAYMRESSEVFCCIHSVHLFSTLVSTLASSDTMVLVAVLGRKLFIKLKSQYIKHMKS